MYLIREKYKDWLGNEREEDFRFNISEADLTKMQFSKNGGFDTYLKKIIDTQDQKEIMSIFEQIIAMSYGVISNDGRKFVKSDEILEDFKATPAYDQIYMRLISNSEFAAEFVNNVFPQDLLKSVRENGGAPEVFNQNAGNKIASIEDGKKTE